MPVQAGIVWTHKLGPSLFCEAQLILELFEGSQFIASLISRMWAGHFADSRGPTRAVLPGLVVAAVSGCSTSSASSCCARRVGFDPAYGARGARQRSSILLWASKRSATRRPKRAA
jgi:hypothetical protein